MKINLSIDTEDPGDLLQAQALLSWLAEQDVEPADVALADLIDQARGKTQVDRTAAKQRAAEVLSWAGGRRG